MMMIKPLSNNFKRRQDLQLMILFRANEVIVESFF